MINLKAKNIMAVLIVVLTFEGLLFGAEIAERTFPTISAPEGGGFWSSLSGVVAVVQGAIALVVFMFNLITFGIPGVPDFIRVMIGGIQGVALVYSAFVLFRGGGGDD